MAEDLTNAHALNQDEHPVDLENAIDMVVNCRNQVNENPKNKKCEDKPATPAAQADSLLGLWQRNSRQTQRSQEQGQHASECTTDMSKGQSNQGVTQDD